MEPANPKDIPLPHSPLSPSFPAASVHSSDPSKRPPSFIQRLSLRNLSFVRSHEHKPMLSATEEAGKQARASDALAKRIATPVSTTSGRRTKESALILRSLIMGPQATPASPKVTKSNALGKIKSQLMKPKSANKLIAQLRVLPVSDGGTGPTATTAGPASARAPGPIHAVCLEHTDAEEDELHFSQLTQEVPTSLDAAATQSFAVTNVANASLEALTNLFQDMHVISLITAPDFGLGQPGDGQGILAGAVPTAETVIKGIGQITPQLMALGYATGQAFYPDHSGVHPPTDRMSVLTYWWGLELVLPPPSIAYLSNAQSISSSIMNFLTAVSLVNNGIREILPFIRYISQFIDFEFSSIKKQDKGKGVVCAATWIMPAAMVPRPWDFTAPPPKPAVPTPAATTTTADPRPFSEDSTASGEVVGQPYVPLPAEPPTLPDFNISSPKASVESKAAMLSEGAQKAGSG